MSCARDLTAVASIVLSLGCAARATEPSSKPASSAASPTIASSHVSSVPADAAFVETIPGTTVKLEMIPIPTGELRMQDPANPSAIKSVRIGPLWMGKTEVTWDAYDVFVYHLDEKDPAQPASSDAVTRPSRPYLPPDRGYGHEGFPAIAMSAHAAAQFCRWLSATTGRHYRLPTEAEWWYAWKEGSTIPSLGDVGADEDITAYGWLADNSEARTHRVATKPANALGLHDMIGNASEWCTNVDGQPVALGCSFRDAVGAISFVTGCRAYPSPSWNASDPQIPKSQWWLADAGFVGFRVVCDPDK